MGSLHECDQQLKYTIEHNDIFEHLQSSIFLPKRKPAMPVHSTSFPTDQPLRPAEAAEALLPAAAPQVLTAKKLNFRKLLLTGAAIAALAGAGWDGWGYLAGGPYLVVAGAAPLKAPPPTTAP